MNRRDVLKAAAALGIRFRQDDRASIRPKEGDLLVKLGDGSTTPLTADDIPLGARPTVAWAMDPADNTVRSGSRLNQLLLVRLDPGKLAPQTPGRSAARGLAYNAIFTHKG